MTRMPVDADRLAGFAVVPNARVDGMWRHGDPRWVIRHAGGALAGRWGPAHARSRSETAADSALSHLMPATTALVTTEADPHHPVAGIASGLLAYFHETAPSTVQMWVRSIATSKRTLGLHPATLNPNETDLHRPRLHRMKQGTCERPFVRL